MTKRRTSKANRAASTDVLVVDPNVTVVLPGKPGRDSARPLREPSCTVSVEAIRDLAHRKWEAAGRPVGDGLHFWLEAERELNAERVGAHAVPVSERPSR